MCLMGGGQAAPAPQVAPAPTRETVTAKGLEDATGYGAPTAIAQTKNKISKRLGIFGNFSSTPMGDTNYNTNTKATFGSVGNAA